MNSLYFNNRYITSYSDLKEVFKLLKDVNNRPEFLQDEILEAFFSGWLELFLDTKGYEEQKKKLENFKFQYYNTVSETKQNREILDALFKIFLDDTYSFEYKCQNYIYIESVCISRENLTFSEKDAIRFNKNASKEEYLKISINGVVKKIINGTINLFAQIYHQDGETTEILPMNFSFNLANCKEKEHVSANCEIDIKDIKKLEESNYVIVIEDELGNIIHKREFVVHSEFDNEIPLEFIGYCVKEGDQKKSGILFNRQAPSEGYSVEFNFKVIQSSDSLIKFRTACHELNLNNDDDNIIDLREKNKNDIVTYILNIKFSQDILNALDGRYLLTCDEYCSSSTIFPQIFICLYGGKYNCELHGIHGESNVLEFTSYCDNDNQLFLISDYIDAPIVSLANSTKEWSSSNLRWPYDYAQQLVKVLNKKDPSKHFCLPSSDLILKTRSLTTTNYYDEFTDDYHDPVWGLSEVLVVKRDGRREWEGLIGTCFSFRLCLRHVEPDTPEDYTLTDDDWYLYKISHYD